MLMEIITRLDTLGISDELIEEVAKGNTEDAIEEVFSELNSAYSDRVGPDMCVMDYLYEDLDPEHFHFGSLEPEHIKARAKAWMLEIKKEFLDALDVLKTQDGNLPAAADLPVDTTDTWRMSMAARELDNAWHSHTRHAVYLENDCGWAYFQVQLAKEDAADMIEHPERYVIAEVFVKD